MNGKTALVLIVLILAVVAAYIWWPRDCSFSARKRSLGIDLEVGLDKVNSVKSKIGISDDQVRDYDNFTKDLATKYDMACNDFKNKRMNGAEYSCRRKNMDDMLDKLRLFLTKVQAAAGLSDPSAQKEVVLRALSDLEEVEKKGYAAGCTSAMNVSPRTLPFDDHAWEHSVQISNSGNNQITFGVADLPRGFIPQPSSGNIVVGQTVSVAIIRTSEPITNNPPLTFRLTNNFLDEVPIEIQFDQQNAGLYDDLANKVQSLSSQHNRAPTVDDALQIVDESLPKSSSWTSIKNADSMRYFLAAGLLSRAGSASAAHQALDTATAKNPDLERQPATLILRGVVVNREGKPDEALHQFSKANILVAGSKTEKDTRALTSLLSGAVAQKQGQDAASVWLGKKEVQDTARYNPRVLNYAKTEIKTKDLNEAIQKASSKPVTPP
jgi:hypothetical protein